MGGRRKNIQIYELLENETVKSGGELQVTWKQLKEKNIPEHILRTTGWVNGITVKSTIFGVIIKKSA